MMITTNIIQRDISEMEKHSIQKGQHIPKDRKRFGNLEFVVSNIAWAKSNHRHKCVLIELNMIEFVDFIFHFLSTKQIGCGGYFTAGNTIAKRFSRQMDENLISQTSGLNFGWWCIWEKQPNFRYVRTNERAIFHFFFRFSIFIFDVASTFIKNIFRYGFKKKKKKTETKNFRLTFWYI